MSSSQTGPLRRATHAGSWYSSDGPKLYAELSSWLSSVTPKGNQANVIGEGSSGFDPPIKGCKAIIAPHAGYSYSGPAAAWAYKSIDTTGIKRVFILGPSHHFYLDGCALSQCSAYETPIGDLPLDRETINDLKATGAFTDMDLSTDEEEHSIEMHLPYIRKVFERIDIRIVPVLVGSIPKAVEQRFGDFCHWGTRFNYTFYYPSPLPLGPDVEALRLSSSIRPQATHPIHASITDLDREGMDILRIPPIATDSEAATSTHDRFSRYMSRTRNTICGRHPIGVLLGALTALEAEERKQELKWVRYEQSSQCRTIRDSSVSYASAYVVF